MRSIEHSCSAARVFFFFFSSSSSCFFFFVTRHTHYKSMFCGVMISRTENQKILVQRDESIEIELVLFVFRLFLCPSVHLQRNRKFCMETVFFPSFGIIKMKLARKVSLQFVLTNNLIMK
jgi:hypothetical protein